MLRAPLVALLFVAVALAGCSSPPPNPAPTPTPTPTTPTPEPTPTPAPSPTPAPTPGCAAAAPVGKPLPGDAAGRLFHERAQLEEPGRVAAQDRAAWKGGGAALADSDCDRLLDYFVSGPTGVKLYRNTSAGARTDVTVAVGLNACSCKALGVAPADYDNDGYADLLVLLDGAAPKLYHNDAGARFTEVKVPGLPADATGATWFDLDNDGRLDLFATRSGGDPVALRNAATGWAAFDGIVFPAGTGAARGAAFVDLDADHFVDLVLWGDGGLSALRNGNGTWARFGGTTNFTSATVARTVAVGDYDDSGTEDLLLAGDGGLSLLSNNRGRSFRVVTPLTTDAMFAATFLDYDLDGFLDVLAVPQAGGLQVWHNPGQGGGSFTKLDSAVSGLPETGEFRGLALGDFDNDGRTDALATRLDAPAVLYHNGNSQGASPGKFFKVVPTGNQTAHDGTGARAQITRGDNLLEVRYVQQGGAGLVTSAPEVVFGLGASNATNLRILWPSGTLQDQTIPGTNNADRILLANEVASKSEWGDNAC